MHPPVRSALLVEIELKSMNIEYPHAGNRRIDKLEVSTPLIAPSFSSRGFPHISNVWEEFKHKLYGVCLVSAFDVAEMRIPADATDMVNVIIVDSGLYETSEEYSSGKLHASALTSDWTRVRYKETVRDIGQKGNVILVNFDEIGKLEEQIERSSEDFSYAPHAVSDFLVKPTDPSGLVNLAKLVHHQEELRQFDIIGITAREVGNSFLRRCSSVVTLRNLLNDMRVGTPIHIFGAINPYEVLTYFLCGADIFDGLNWLRLAFRSHASLPVDESAMEGMKWNLTDLDLLAEEWTHNLRFLYQLQEALQRYAANGDLTCLIDEFPLARQAAYIAEIAGAEIRR